MKISSLPLWYIIGIVVVVLVSLFNYIGTRQGIAQKNIDMVLRFEYMNYILIGTWFVINIIIIFYLFNINARKFDYLMPVYFLFLHFFYISVIFLSFYDIYLSIELALIISMITTTFELCMAGYLLVPYMKGVGYKLERSDYISNNGTSKSSKSSIKSFKKNNIKTNINKRKTRPKK